MGNSIQCQGNIFAPIDAIIFDKDGTLAHSYPFLYQLGRSRTRLLDAQIPGVQDPLLMAFGFEDNTLSPQGLLAVGSRWENEVAAAAYVAETGRGWVESLNIVKAAFQETDAALPPKAEKTPIVEGVDTLVRSLAQAHIRLGILSSDTTQNVVAFAQAHHLESYFEFLAGVDTLDKREPSACAQFLQHHQINPAHTLVIGDSDADAQLAQALGASCIGVTWDWNSSYPIAGAGAIAASPQDVQLLKH